MLKLTMLKFKDLTTYIWLLTNYSLPLYCHKDGI